MHFYKHTLVQRERLAFQKHLYFVELSVYVYLCREFEACGFGARDEQSLKSKWNQLKCQMRKDHADFIQGHYKTGSGEHEPIVMPNISQMVQDIMELVSGSLTGVRGHMNRPDDGKYHFFFFFKSHHFKRKLSFIKITGLIDVNKGLNNKE